MDKFEADRVAQREASNRIFAARKDYVISDPVELFQALQPANTLKLYFLLGVLTTQGLSIGPPWKKANTDQEQEQIINTVTELSKVIDSAVEKYIEEDHGE